MRAYLPMCVSLFISLLGLGCTADHFIPNEPWPVVTLSVDPTNATVPIGTSVQLSAIPRDSMGATFSGLPTTWTTSNGSIASVAEDGIVTGMAAGSVEVIATVEGKSDTAAITVTSAPPGSPTLEAVVLTPDSVTLQSGATRQFAASGRMSDGTMVPVNVTYSATGGTITSSGFYTAGTSAGAFRVIATQQAGTKADTSTVTVITAPAPPPPAVCTGVQVLPGASIQGAVNANPAGTTFCLRAGLHRQQTVTAKDGNSFLGEAGTILDGEGVAVHAFNASGRNVTIKRLVIRNYNNPVQTGAIHGLGTTGWTVDSNEVTGNRGGGIAIGTKMKVRWNNVHHNHQIGISGIGDSILVEGNEIHFNNWLKENEWGWEAGGTKFVRTTNLIVRKNYSHDNWGPGLWTDISNLNALYEHNRVEDNAGPGIFHEISQSAVIRYNTIRRNGFDFAGWVWGGGIQIGTSRDVEIYGNTLEDNKVGISIAQQNRAGPYCVDPCLVQNINIHDNTVIQRATVPGEGFPAAAGRDFGDTNDFHNGIKFTSNHYYVQAVNQAEFGFWDRGNLTWAQWQGYGLDVTGTLTIIP